MYQALYTIPNPPPPHKKNVLSQFFYFVIALGKATFLAKIALSAKMCLKIKNVP